MVAFEVVLAQTAEPNDWTSLAQYGVLGLVVLGFILGKIVPGYVYERRLEEAERKDEEIQRLRVSIEERVIPALIKSTEALADAASLLEDRTVGRPRA